jgi:ribose transport system permease protein
VKPGRFNVWGAVIAIYTLATGVKGLSLATGALWVNDMFNGVALIVAVGFATWRQRAMLKRPRRASPVKVSTEVPEFPAAGGLPERESVRESDSGDPSRQTAQEY